MQAYHILIQKEQFINVSTVIPLEIKDEEMIKNLKLDDPNNVILIALPENGIKKNITVLSATQLNLEHYLTGFLDCVNMAKDWDSFFPPEEEVKAQEGNVNG